MSPPAIQHPFAYRVLTRADPAAHLILTSPSIQSLAHRLPLLDSWQSLHSWTQAPKPTNTAGIVP